MDMTSLQNLMNQHRLRLRRRAREGPDRTDRRRAADDEGQTAQGRSTCRSRSRRASSATTEGRMRPAHRVDEGGRRAGQGAARAVRPEARRRDERQGAARASRFRTTTSSSRPARCLPPPEIAGRLARVTVERQPARAECSTTGPSTAAPLTRPSPRGQELHLFRRRRHPLRQADDARCRSAADRQRPEGSVRLLPGALQRAAGRGSTRRTRLSQGRSRPTCRTTRTYAA